MNDDAPQTARGANQPLGDRLGIGTNQGGKLARAVRRQTAPLFRDRSADQRNVGNPGRRRRQAEPGSGFRQRRDHVGMPHERRDRERHRQDDQHEEDEGHHGDRRSAAPAERGFEPAQQRPCRDHQRGRPDRRREERLEHLERGGDQPADEQDGERYARQIE